MHIPATVIPKKYIIIGGVAVFVVVALVPAIYYFQQYQKVQERIANPTQAAKDDAKATVSTIGKFMLLPSDEDPTIATVSDITKLKDQPFFANAQNGDKVLIYSKAKMAILYRPEANKIIGVAPVNIGSAATQSAQLTQAAGRTYSLVLRNGTTTVGLTKIFEDKVKTKLQNLTIADRDNAKKTTYKETIIVDVTGDKSAEAGKLASTFGITVGILPVGESTPAADFLIILGADQK